MKSLLLLFLTLLFIGCLTNKNKLTREKSSINQEAFYATDNKFEGANYINQMSLDMGKAFSLVPLKQSTADKEIRIYFASVWHEIFFIEKYQNDSLIVEVYKCETQHKNDSMFMKIQSSVIASGKYDISEIPKFDTLPAFKNCMIEDTVQYIDKGYMYFIQIKSGKSIRSMLLNDNCFESNKDKESVYIKNFIELLTKRMNFSFYDPWATIDSLAFKDN